MAWLAAMMFALICTFTCTTFARSQSLDLQEQCASQARKTFGELKSEYQAVQSPLLLEPGVVDGDYQSHYNTKLKRCLILITLSGSYSTDIIVFYSQWFLVDANERRYYAYYYESKSSAVRCELTPSFVQNLPCKTREDFDAFVAPYMED